MLRSLAQYPPTDELVDRSMNNRRVTRYTANADTFSNGIN